MSFRQTNLTVLMSCFMALALCEAHGQEDGFAILTINAGTNSLELLFRGPSILNDFIIQKSSGLVSPVWESMSGVIATPLGGGSFKAVLPLPSSPVEFYRVMSALNSDGTDLTGWFGEVSFPSNLVAGIGASGSAALVIQNQGNRSLSGAQSPAVRIMARPLEGGPDALLLNVEHQVPVELSPGHFQTLNFNFIFPTNLSTGNYRVVAMLDASNAVAETDESNNLVTDPTIRQVASPFVDLFTQVKLILLGGSLRAGDVGYATLTLGNAGNVLAGGLIDLQVFASTNVVLGEEATLLGSITNYLCVLPARKATDLKLTVQFPIDIDADEYHLIARIEPKGSIGDTNPTNNVYVDPELYSLSQDFSLDDFRGFEVVGASWNYDSSACTSIRGPITYDLCTFGIQNVRVEAWGTNAGDGTRVVTSQAGKNIGALTWQSDAEGTKLLAQATFGDRMDLDFAIDRLVVAPPSFNPKSGAVFLGESEFSAWVTNRVEDNPLTLFISGTSKSKLRLLGYEDVVLQSGEPFRKALKFEMSISSTSTVSLVIEGDPISLGDYLVNEVQTVWAVSGTGVVKSVSYILTTVDQNGGTPLTVLNSASLELVRPDASLAAALDGVSLEWLSPVAAGWKAQTNVTHDMSDAAQSAPLLDKQMTAMETTVTGPGEGSFWWRVSSEPDYDFLKFSLDGEDPVSLSGEVGWKRQDFFVPEGRHVLEWAYEKDEGGAAGYDTAWVDQVVYLPDVGPPWVQSQPQSVSVIEGMPAELRVVARGLYPLRYQWEKDSMALVGATNAELTIANTSLAEAGSYRVLIQNSIGSTNSQSAILTVSPQAPLAQAVDAPGLNWTTKGRRPWIGQLEVTHDGVDAAQSGSGFEGGGSFLETGVIGPGTVSYFWKVSTDPDGYDYLRFAISGSQQAKIDGETTWEARSFFVPAGLQSLEWMYWKDNDGRSLGADMGWVDQVSFMPDSGPPILLTQPQSLVVTQGMDVELSVTVRGQWPFAYQWQKNEVNISGATNGILAFTNVQVLDLGQYRVQVMNPGGEVWSTNATLTVIWVCNLGEALDAAELAWSSGGGEAWQCETTMTHDLVAAVRSGRISDGQSSFVETIVTGPGELGFWWRVSSEQDFDILKFTSDGTTVKQISGEKDWRLESVSVPAGQHTLRWTYDKDSGLSAGEDAGWLDQVSYLPGAPSGAHRILRQWRESGGISTGINGK